MRERVTGSASPSCLSSELQAIDDTIADGIDINPVDYFHTASIRSVRASIHNRRSTREFS
jgi:hypothetical protein